MDQYETEGTWIVPKLIKRYLLWKFGMSVCLTMLLFLKNIFLELFNWKSTYFLILLGNFTHDAQKYQLWVQICEFDPKHITKLFKSVCDNCFFVLWEKKNKMQKFYNRPNLGHFCQKTRFLAFFFFDPSLFSAGNRQTRKKIFVGHPK